MEYEKIKIFDTTLRDGLQSALKKLSIDARIHLAELLAKMGVDVIEAGFANSNYEDSRTIREVANTVGQNYGTTICSLARLHQKDIKLGIEAIQGANKKRLHTFIATSKIHMENKLRMSPDEVLHLIDEHISYAARTGKVDEIQFSLEDFSRTEDEFGAKAAITACKAGATIINPPDTVGFALPDESGEKVARLIYAVKKAGYNPVISAHNHDDLGLATANTYFAIKAGARQIETTINGIGERAGNSALEEIVAILSTREVFSSDGKRLGFEIDKSMIGEISRYVSKMMGIPVASNKAVVGSNAFAHGSGIHQDGMSKDSMTYEILDGPTYGVEGTKIFLGPYSGKAGIQSRAKEIGLNISEQDATRIARYFSNHIKREYADDVDLVMAVKEDRKIPDYFKLIECHPLDSLDRTFMSVVKMKVGNKTVTEVAKGKGRIDAAANAIRSAIGRPMYNVSHYEVGGIEQKTDAVASAKIEFQMNGYKVLGLAKNDDVFLASINAFVEGANRMRYMEERMGLYSRAA